MGDCSVIIVEHAYTEVVGMMASAHVYRGKAQRCAQGASSPPPFLSSQLIT